MNRIRTLDRMKALAGLAVCLTARMRLGKRGPGDRWRADGTRRPDPGTAGPVTAAARDGVG